MITDIFADFEFIESCLKREVEKTQMVFNGARDNREQSLLFTNKMQHLGIIHFRVNIV